MSLERTWVTFVWHGARAALPAKAVTAIVDRPALGPLPTPLANVAAMLAYGGELCPVIATPEASADAPVLVCLDAAGNVALRVGEPVRVENGEPQDNGTVVIDKIAVAVLNIANLVAHDMQEVRPC